jgi:hypothetical protein
MFTEKFKVIIGIVVLAIGFVIVATSQLSLVHRVTLLEERPASIIKEPVMVTDTPTATPTAVLKLIPATRVPVKAVTPAVK